MTRLLLLLAALPSLIWAQAPVSSLHATHDALFATFLPLEEVHETPDVEAMFLAARDGIWAAASDATAFQQLVTPFMDLRAFGASCHMTRLLLAVAHLTGK